MNMENLDAFDRRYLMRRAIGALRAVQQASVEVNEVLDLLDRALDAPHVAPKDPRACPIGGCRICTPATRRRRYPPGKSTRKAPGKKRGKTT